MIQKLPAAQNDHFDDDDEDWNRINLLIKTITAEEMLNLSAIDVIKRLYHQEDVRIYE